MVPLSYCPKRSLSKLTPVVISLMLMGVGEVWGQALPAFSGAEGAGATASGGRGYTVYHVTNLNNAGPGSFRDAVSASNRIIVFDVGGTIKLGPDPVTNELSITANNITIAGQTAPGNGIFIYGQCLKFGSTAGGDSNNVVVRNLHVRAGEDPFGRSGDCINVNGRNTIIDHCSVEWASDELLSGWHGGYNNTVQYSIVSEALNYAGHGYGSLVGSDEPNVVLSYHHNLYAHDVTRCPRLGNENHAVNVTDWRNNVMYDWQTNCGYSSGGGGGNYAWGNFVGNYYIAGNSTSIGFQAEAFNAAGTFTHLYQSGNKIDPNLNGVFDGTDTGWAMFTGTYVKESSVLAAPAVTTQSADEALQTVLNYAGANWWNRDSVDARIVNDVQTGGGTIKNWMTDVGGLTYYPEVHRSADFDTDNDGMPNAWELAHGLDPNADDHNGDFDADGYTNIEEYINDLAAFPAPKPIVWSGGTGRYELITNWAIPWQPSVLDKVEINSGKATVGYIGQTAGTIDVGNSPGGTGELAVTAGALTLENGLRVGAASGAKGTMSLSGGVLVAGGKLYVGSAGAGTFVQTGGSCRSAGGVVIGDAVGSSGRYELKGGTLSTPQLSKGNGNGEFRFTGGTLHADQVTFGLTNEGGVLAPGNSIGTTYVAGDLTLDDGVTEIELASLTSFDKIFADGLASLGGTLNVKLLDGYVPQAADTWKIFSAESFTGQFDSISAGFMVDAVGGDLVLMPIPEPATLILLVAGAGLLMRPRRRRWTRTGMALMSSLLMVLTCASVTPAAVVNKYDFNSLTTGAINGKSGNNVTWKSISGTVNVFRVMADPNDSNDKYVDSNQSSVQEQTVGTMTNPATVHSVFNLAVTDTLLRISFISRMNYAAGGLVGIWVDGIDPSANSMQTTNAELACQFGMSGGQWRVRGANSATSVLDATGMPLVNGEMPWLKIILDVDLTGNSGNGSMSLSVVDLDTDVTTLPPSLQDVSMGLLSQDSRLGDPTKWTGWWFRGQQAAGAANPAVCPWGYTIDNLVLETVPEPATLSLLVLGGLACLRRRTLRPLVGEKLAGRLNG